MLIAPPLSLYVHLPWCLHKCPYCDFNSHAIQGEVPHQAYLSALVADLDHDLPWISGRSIHSIFFGGGTPSLFPAATIAAFLQALSQRITIADSAEITLETNPGAVECNQFAQLRQAGVNRLSIGVQSFCDHALRRLGRVHNGQEAKQAIMQAQTAGFTNINLDVMYGLPEQTVQQALNDIELALAFAPTHLSHYQLTLEPNTPFHLRPPSQMPDEDCAWEMLIACQQALRHAGYQHYEISGYARDGYQCEHNLNYWRYGDYLGLGAGAHSKLTLDQTQCIWRRWKRRNPTQYQLTVGTPKAIGGEAMVDQNQRPFEFMLNALRLHEGFDVHTYQTRTGLSADTLQQPLDLACQKGLLHRQGSIIRATELGRRFNNNVVELFMTSTSNGQPAD